MYFFQEQNQQNSIFLNLSTNYCWPTTIKIFTVVVYTGSMSLAQISSAVYYKELRLDKGEGNEEFPHHEWMASEEPPSQSEDPCSTSSIKIIEAVPAPKSNISRHSSKKSIVQRYSQSRLGEDIKRNHMKYSTFNVIPSSGIKMYKINDKINIEEFDPTVAELRKNRIERMMREQNYQKQHDYLEREKRNKLIKKPISQLASYDAKGLRIFVKYPQLKSLILRCSHSVEDLPYPESTAFGGVSPAGINSQFSLAKNSYTLEDWMREAEEKSRLDATEQPEVFSLKGVYEKLNPSGGVSFTEKGKAIKEKNVSPIEQFGSLSRSDISVLQADMTSFLNQTLGSESLNNIPQSSLHFRAKSEMTNLSQLVDQSEYSVNLNSHITSILPTGSTFIPSTYKRNIKILHPLDRTPDETRTSILKLFSTGEGNQVKKFKTLNKGSKVTLKQLQNSIGIDRKVPRIRVLPILKRLPPPPVGFSSGHGIFQS